MKLFTLNAFAKTPEGGNPAGVVLDADELTEEDMQAIAKEAGFSETAFVRKSAKANFKVQFFTPNAEVDLCGHATIATFTLLTRQKIIQAGRYTQETKAGVLGIEVMEDQSVFMDQKLPEYFEEIDKAAVAKTLAIPPHFIRGDLPVQVVSTGLRDIMIPIRRLEELLQIQPDFEKVKALSQKFNVVGYHLFTPEIKFGGTAHCRNLAPLYEIDEEAATGTSSGALAAYLFKYGQIAKEEMGRLVFEQGYSMNRPSEIKAKLEAEAGEITRVQVGGTAIEA